MRPTLGVLFVCLGNICRSPTAEAVMARRIADAGLADAVWVDSCGTAAYHIGSPPDRRAQRAGAARGYDLSPLRARQLQADDFSRFDYLLAMDAANLRAIQAIAPRGHRGEIRLLMDCATAPAVREVPDPYYGAGDGFAEVLDLVEQATEGLLGVLQARLTG